MKNKKPLVIGIATVLLILTFSYLIGTGLRKRTDVILTGYSVSEDGTEITLEASVQSSMGYIRGFKDAGGSIKPHYLTFYATFDGLNSSFGAKNAFVLKVNEDDCEIYFNRADGGYELVLQKNLETGMWEEPHTQG